MNKIASISLSAALCILSANRLHAQRTNNALIRAGGNFHGFYLSAGLDWNLMKYDDLWRFELCVDISSECFHPHSETVPVQSYSAMAGIRYGGFNKLLKTTAKFYNWKSYLGTGFAAGFEQVNGGKDPLESGARLKAKNQSVYGIFTDIDFRVPISSRTSVYLEFIYRACYWFNSDLGSRSNRLGIGLIIGL